MLFARRHSSCNERKMCFEALKISTPEICRVEPAGNSSVRMQAWSQSEHIPLTSTPQILAGAQFSTKTACDFCETFRYDNDNSTSSFDNRQPPSTTTSVTMGRLHSKGKGISSSATPYSRTPPSWLKTTPDQVVEQICRLAKRGATPSQIGVILRDSHGIAQVRFVTGKFLPSQQEEEGIVWTRKRLTNIAGHR